MARPLPMANQLVVLDETFIADVAAVMLLSGVNTHVCSQSGVLTELAVTKLAIVRTFSGMSPGMYIQLKSRHKVTQWLLI